MATESNIHLYTTQTPNGIKISILLEELGLPYEVTSIKFSTNEQKQPAFLEINPNGRIPALTDTFTDGKEIRLFESGSIMQYLVDRYDKQHNLSYPAGSREYIETNNWLFFQNAGVGPMQGQANHFTRYAPEHIEYGVNRYQNETRRLYGILDKRLSDTKSPYLVGDKCTIADISHWGWISAAGWAGVDIDDFPTLKQWEERMWARPALQKGANVPEPYRMKELLQDKERMERHATQSRAWVQQGMKEDAEKHAARTRKRLDSSDIRALDMSSRTPEEQAYFDEHYRLVAAKCHDESTPPSETLGLMIDALQKSALPMIYRVKYHILCASLSKAHDSLHHVQLARQGIAVLRGRYQEQERSEEYIEGRLARLMVMVSAEEASSMQQGLGETGTHSDGQHRVPKSEGTSGTCCERNDEGGDRIMNLSSTHA